MLSLLISISKQDNVKDQLNFISYYNIAKQFSDGDYSVYPNKSFSNLGDLVSFVLGDLDLIDGLNKVTIIVTNDDNLKKKLSILTAKQKDEKLSRTKLFNLEFKDSKQKEKYKSMLNAYCIDII